MTTHLLLIGIDGLRADLVDAGLAPTLAGLLGGDVSRMTMPVPTMSGPIWSTLLTGTTVAVHGVTGNDFAGQRLADAPDLLTRIAAVDPAAATLAVASWLPLIDPDGPGPVLRARPDDVAAGRHRAIMRDGEIDGYEIVDADLADRAFAAVEADGPTATFVYFCDVDEAGHRFGARSLEYRAAIGRVDGLVARLLAVVERRSAVGEPWLVAVTTDHGHLDAGGHGGAEPEVSSSFVALRGFGLPAPSWPERIAPEELTPRLLAAVR